jgi:hypothetical protein
MPRFVIQQTLPQFANIMNIQPKDSIFTRTKFDDIDEALKLEVLNAIKEKEFAIKTV